MENNTIFNPNSTKYCVTSATINYGFIADFCGAMRGYESMHSEVEEDEFTDLRNTCSRELRLHWLPIAAREVVRSYHLAAFGTKSTEAIEEVRNYLVTAFKNVSTKYDLFDSDKWRTPEIINAVYEEIFWGHPITYTRIKNADNLDEEIYQWTIHVMNSIGARLQLTIDAIITSDKYKLTEHAYILQHSGNSYDNEIGAIIIRTINSSSVSDFNPIPIGYKDAWDQDYMPGTDYENLVRWNDLVKLTLKW